MPAINPMQALYSRLGATGVDKKFAQRLLPDWWDDSLGQTPSGLLQAQMIIARSLNFELGSLRDPTTPIQFRTAQRKFKHSKAVDKRSIQLSAEFATGLARLAAQAVITPYIPLPPDPTGIRNRILAKHSSVDLNGLLDYCANAGIPVLHVGKLPGKKMDAVALKLGGRAAIVLCRNDKSSHLLFHLAHEVGHIALGHLGQTDSMLIDEKIASGDIDLDEQQADSFAIRLLNGSEVRYSSKNRYITPGELASSAVRLGRERHIDAGHIVLNYGHATKNFPLANAALALVPMEHRGAKIVNEKVTSTLDFNELSDDQASLLNRSLTAFA